MKVFICFTGFSTLASVVPSKVITTEGAISRFSPNDRDCNTDKESSMKFLSHEQGFRYSLHNCLYEIVIQNILNNCSCYYPINQINGSKVSPVANFKSQKLRRKLHQAEILLTLMETFLYVLRLRVCLPQVERKCILNFIS